MWVIAASAAGVLALSMCVTSLVVLRILRLHHHLYEPVAAQASTFAGLDTVVLYRCDCGDVDTRTFIGRWTLDQIRGAEPVVRALREVR